MDAPRTPVHDFVMRFAEVLDEVGRRLHVGCIMAAGQDWVEVSVPPATELAPHLQLRFFPSRMSHEVTPVWREADRVGFTYEMGGPPEDQFAGFPGLCDPRPAAIKRRR